MRTNADIKKLMDVGVIAASVAVALLLGSRVTKNFVALPFVLALLVSTALSSHSHFSRNEFVAATEQPVKVVAGLSGQFTSRHESHNRNESGSEGQSPIWSADFAGSHSLSHSHDVPLSGINLMISFAGHLLASWERPTGVDNVAFDLPPRIFHPPRV